MEIPTVAFLRAPALQSRPRQILPLAALVLGGALQVCALAPVARADVDTGKNVQERQVLDYGPGGGKPSNGSILDATNPIDLMNRIRRATALDESTPPGDAVDQALRALEAQPVPAASPSAPLVKGP